MRSAVLTVPQTPSWMVQIRWMESEGASVTKGQRVLEFDNTPFASTLEEKQLAEEEANAELVRFSADAAAQDADKAFAVEQRRVELEKANVEAAVPVTLRSRREYEDKQLARQRAEVALAKAKEELKAYRDGTRAELSIRKVALEKARREVAIAKGAIEALTLVAPQDGTIVVADYFRERRKLQVGDAVPVGSPVLRIPDLSEQRVEATLFDVDDGRLAAGAPARCAVDAFPDRVLTGTVKEISPMAQQPFAESLRRGFRVVVALDTTDPTWMRPGMSVKVEVPLANGAARAGATAPAQAAGTAPEAPHGTFVAARRETLVVGVELRGALAAVDSDLLGAVPLANIWEYKIAMMAPEGKAIRKGQPALAFDTNDLTQKLAVQEAEADAAAKQIDKRRSDLDLARQQTELKLAEAEARLRKAGLKVDVPPELAKANELAQAVLDRGLAETETRTLREKLDAARRAGDADLAILESKKGRALAKVAELKAAIASMSLPAPRDGVVVYLTNWRDEKKKVGDSCWRGEKVLEIPDVTRMRVRGEVDEVDGGRVAEGQRVSLRLDAYPDLELTGKVRQIWRTVQRQSPKSPVKVIRLEVDLDAVDRERMRPGMRVRGTIETARVPGALTVPAGCVVASANGPVVFRKGAGGAKAVPVTLGRRNRSSVEILSGLSEGDQVVRPGGKGA